MSKDTLNPEEIERIRNEDLKNLIKKVARGIPLNNAEWGRLLQHQEGEERASLTANTQVELAEACGVSRRTISTKLKDPKSPGSRSNGKYDITAWKMYLKNQGSIEDSVDVADAILVFAGELWRESRKKTITLEEFTVRYQDRTRELIEMALQSDVAEMKKHLEVERLRIICDTLAIDRDLKRDTVVNTVQAVNWINEKIGTWRKQIFAIPNAYAGRLSRKKAAQIKEILQEALQDTFVGFTDEIDKEITNALASEGDADGDAAAV